MKITGALAVALLCASIGLAQQKKIAGALETAELERIKSTNPTPPHYQ